MLRIFAPVLVTLVTFISSQGMAACQVPVCDIVATINELKTKSIDERHQFYSDLYNNNINATDAAVLRNLNAFGVQAYKLSKDMNDPKGTITWAATVRQLGQGLLTYASFQKTEFINTYTESAVMPELTRTGQQRVRYSALYRWRTEVAVMFNVNEVYAVYDYVQKAADYSRQINDEEYILREGQAVLELLSSRITYLFPLYEGVFAIATKCNLQVGQCTAKDVASDRLVVLNTLNDYELASSLAISSQADFLYAIGQYHDDDVSHETKGINFLFVNSTIKNNGTNLYSKSDVLYVGDRPAEIKVAFNNAQDLNGSAVTSRYVGALSFAGKVIFTPLKYYTDEVPLQAGEQPLTGEFKGKFGNEPMRLIIRQRVDGTYMASAFVNEQAIDFSMGQFVTHRQLMNLTGLGMRNFTPYKLTIAYRMGADKQMHWFGGFYSVNGFFAEVALDYVGPVIGL